MYKFIISHILISYVACYANDSPNLPKVPPNSPSQIISREINEGEHSFVWVELNQMVEKVTETNLYPRPIAKPKTFLYPESFWGAFTQREIQAFQIINTYYSSYFKDPQHLNKIINKEFTDHIIGTYKHFLHNYRQNLREKSEKKEPTQKDNLIFPDEIHDDMRKALEEFFAVITFERTNT